jgi:Tat protein translocase TatB subunit
MFGSLGGQELFLILVLALLLFGPRALPQIGRTLGRALAELRHASQEFKSGLEREVELEEIRKTRTSLESAVRDADGAASGAEPPASRTSGGGASPEP